MKTEIEVVKIEPYLLDTEQAALFLGVTSGTLRNWRNAGKGPKFVRYSKGNGRSPARYKLADLKAWADALEA